MAIVHTVLPHTGRYFAVLEQTTRFPASRAGSLRKIIEQFAERSIFPEDRIHACKPLGIHSKIVAQLTGQSGTQLSDRALCIRKTLAARQAAWCQPRLDEVLMRRHIPVFTQQFERRFNGKRRIFETLATKIFLLKRTLPSCVAKSHPISSKQLSEPNLSANRVINSCVNAYAAS